VEKDVVILGDMGKGGWSREAAKVAAFSLGTNIGNKRDLKLAALLGIFLRREQLYKRLLSATTLRKALLSFVAILSPEH
jgi:hypothetical protein